MTGPADRMFDDIRFWQQVILDQRRTYFCPPALVERLTEVVHSYGMEGMVTVRPCELLRDQVIVADTSALEASMRAEYGITGMFADD